MLKIDRRKLLKTSSIAAAGTGSLPLFSIGKSGPSANSKLNIAMIGAGGIANHAYAGCATENIVALCDVEASRFGQHQKTFPAIGNAARYTDFRVMLDKMGNEIDAVCINTPDHTHFVATMEAMQRGKHVCTQKPLTHNIWQARTLRKAKEKYGVITNMANQGHTYDGIRKMREMVEAGIFGDIEAIHAGMPAPNWNNRFFKKPTEYPPAQQPIPDGFDWDLWLGPHESIPHNLIYHPLSWRGFSDFGSGQIGDWFCHVGDGPVWVLGLYEPTVIECVERGPTSPGMSPDHSIVRFDFPATVNRKACSLYWHDTVPNGTPIKAPSDWNWSDRPTMGSYWFGTKENAFLDRRSNNPRLAIKEKDRAFKESGGVEEKYPRVPQDGPFAEWVAAIKGDAPEPGSNFDYSARLSEISSLGVLAQRFGGRLEWDAKKGQITNRPELNDYVREPVRKGWEYGNDLWTLRS